MIKFYFKCLALFSQLNVNLGIKCILILCFSYATCNVAKSQTVLRGKVLDIITEKPIPQAKIYVPTQGVGVMSNESGSFFYNKYYETLVSSDSLIVKADGYKTLSLLAKDVRELMSGIFTIKLEATSDRNHVNNGEHINIFWDTSEGMIDRNIGDELQFIQNFIKKEKPKKVTLTAFSNKIIKEVNLDDFSASVISDFIYNLEYDAPSDYSVIELQSDQVGLIMSNGIPNYGDINVLNDSPFYSYTTIKDLKGQKFLDELTAFTNGKNLSEVYVQIAGKDNSSKVDVLVKGLITSSGRPIQGAEILIKGSLDEYKSDVNGLFEIPVNAGERINVNALGMFPKAFVITEKSNNNIELIPSNQELDEIVLVSRKRKIYVGDRVVNGYDEPGIPGGITEKGDFYITNEDIKSNGKRITEVIQENFVGVQNKVSSQGNEYLEINGREPIWTLNGYKIAQGEPLPLYLMDNEIASIIVKTSITLDTTYGNPDERQLGLIITTKDKAGANNFKNQLLVKNNDYNEEVASISNTNYSKLPNVQGTIKYNGEPLSNATVSLMGTFKQVHTKSDGSYNIIAKLGDVLIVTAPSMFKKEVLVENNIMGTTNLEAKSYDLDELLVTSEKRTDNTVVDNRFGIAKKDEAGYSVSTIQAALNAGATTLRDLIVGKFAGVTVEGGLTSGSATRYKIRGGYQSITLQIDPLWLVNGVPYTTPPTFLDVQFIESITVLKSLAATSRYGSQAVAGVFIIKTRQGDFQEQATKNNQSALITGNDYDGNVTTSVSEALPDYILRFRENGTAQEQFQLYKELSRTQDSPLEYYVDAAQYFQSIDPVLGDNVRADLSYIARNNTKALRTLAYLYELVDDYKKVELVNKRILKIAPHEAQSYRDLALAYQNNGSYDKALELYINILGDRINGVNFEGLEKPLRNELSHLISLHKDKIDFSKLPNEWLRSDFKRDVRMVIDWSDKTVPFEFQFVDPNKKFFKWTHSVQETKERLNDEQKQGFQTEEFIIDDAPSGEWLINVQYLGSEGDYVLPPFLKYTLYRNYGTPKETKEVRVIKLFKQVDKVTLGKLRV